jgi:uncharacterized protein YjbJ (UPF0337 family)
MKNETQTGSMNRDILAGKWKQISGELKTWWGRLTDDDVYWIGGQKDKLTGLLQERYGYTREQAEQEIERRLQEYGDKAAGIVASVSAKAQEFGATAAKKANEAAPIVGEKMESLATAIRESVPREGTLGTATTKVAEGLESASYYLQEKKFAHLGEDLRGLVRRYPLQSIMVGFGLGFLLAGCNKTKQY